MQYSVIHRDVRISLTIDETASGYRVSAMAEGGDDMMWPVGWVDPTEYRSEEEAFNRGTDFARAKVEDVLRRGRG
ncbi:MAG TPA: hypothetical protein DDZ67_05105 [Xanthomonadaceae bacterium]|nr:hypothetical protein [Xanthomonadaceae bacterium]